MGEVMGEGRCWTTNKGQGKSQFFLTLTLKRYFRKEFNRQSSWEKQFANDTEDSFRAIIK